MTTLHRGQWYAAHNLGLSDYKQIQQQQTSRLPQDVGCDECGRFFWRECDKSRINVLQRGNSLCVHTEVQSSVQCVIAGSGA